MSSNHEMTNQDAPRGDRPEWAAVGILPTAAELDAAIEGAIETLRRAGEALGQAVVSTCNGLTGSARTLKVFSLIYDEGAPVADRELPEQRVAVVVFGTVRAVDERDAGLPASYAIQKALEQAVDANGDLIVQQPFTTGDWIVHVHNVMEVGMAAGNGYLWLRSTSKSYHESRSIGERRS